MAQFYHKSITDQSFQFLAGLNKNYKFILIGGWAVFLYTRALKSKDIDIVIDYGQLGRLGEEFGIVKNDRLKKYEIKTGEFDIDIYLSHYSDLGIPAEYIIKNSQTREGFSVPLPEILFTLKLYAWQARRGSIKGRKDELDILALACLSEFNWPDYLKIINLFDLQTEHKNFISFLKKTRSAPELRLNEQQISRLKKKIMQKIKE